MKKAILKDMKKNMEKLNLQQKQEQHLRKVQCQRVSRFLEYFHFLFFNTN